MKKFTDKAMMDQFRLNTVNRVKKFMWELRKLELVNMNIM